VTKRRYLPGVYWLPQRVKDALRFEAVMDQIAASEPVTPEELQPTEPASPSETAPGEIFGPEPTGFDKARPYINRDRSIVDEYHDAAVEAAGVYPCRTEDCDHYAPAPGDACPVCKDDSKRSLFDRDGDAA
jgi:hypothetical protein